MAKGIQIKLGTDVYSLSPVKVERRKVYGWTELKVLDLNGEPCRQASLDANGTTVIPTGAIKMGIVSEDGKWVDKSELQPVHSDGSKAELCPSSFDTGIILDTKATTEEFLDLLVTAVYVLNGENSEALAQKVGNDIYSFRFNYRADYEDAPAYLISNGQSVFIVAGVKAKFEFISLEEQGNLDTNDDEPDEFDLDELDFSMM